MARRFLIALAAALGLVALLVAALPWLAEPALRAALRLAAVDEVDFERLRLAWGDLEVEGLTLGHADQELRHLRVAWRLPDLIGGRLERVELEGLVVRASWRDGSLQLAGLEAADEAGAPPLPIPEIGQAVLRDARLELVTGFGTLRVPFSAQIRTLGGRLAFEATIHDARLAEIEGAIFASATIEGEVPRDAPLALERARASGSIEAASEHATLGPAQRIAGQATVAFDLAQGRATVDLALSDAAFATPDLTVSDASLRQRLGGRYGGGALILQVIEPGALALESIAAPELRAGPLRLRLEPGDRPLLELTLDEGERLAWRQHATLVIEAMAAHLAVPAPVDLASQAGVITLTAQGVGPDLRHATIELADGALRLPQHALALDGIAAQAELHGAGLVPDRTIPIAVGRIGHAGQPSWFAPLALAARLVPGAAGLGFEASLTRIGGGAALEVRGEVAPSGDGRATVELAPVAFGPSLQPKDLAPIAADWLRDASGEIALDGDLTWSGAGITSDLAVLVDQVGFSSGPARLEQINGVVRLDRLWPPTTPPGQQLAIGLLDLGLPLTEGLMTFQLTGGPRLAVEQLQWRLAGGTARAEPFSLGSPLEGLNVTLRAEQLDLGQLLALSRMGGLSGEGSLDGVLPLRVSDGAVIIDGGELAATGPGVLRYAAETAPAALQAGGEGVDLLLQALENFHYEALRLTLDGRTDAAMDIGLHLAGANPDLYDGYPIEFNLDLEGELANILRRGVASWQIPERIRERMQGFGR